MKMCVLLMYMYCTCSFFSSEFHWLDWDTIHVGEKLYMYMYMHYMYVLSGRILMIQKIHYINILKYMYL